MSEGILYIVATPIGNLEDITLRALRVLKDADLIACEDTRVTKKLLSHYEINTQCITYQQHTSSEKINRIIEELKGGKNIAVVTDAGTPGISDPGNILVQAAIEENISVVPIPGPSALSVLVSVAGIDMQQFIFLGFPPHKKGRETFFKKVSSSDLPVMYYDSPHRVLKNLQMLNQFAPEKKIILGRELTKMFEQILRGNAQEIIQYFENNSSKIKGEFVLIAY